MVVPETDTPQDDYRSMTRAEIAATMTLMRDMERRLAPRIDRIIDNADRRVQTRVENAEAASADSM